MGGKGKIAKYILPLILRERKKDQYFVDLFVGGGSLIQQVKGKRIGVDNDKYVIGALNLIKNFLFLIPKNNKEFTKEMYLMIQRGEMGTSIAFKGYVGYAYSFGGKWFGGWASSNSSRDYVNEAYRNALKQSKLIRDVEFICSDYKKVDIPKGSIVYCDPPYYNSQKYKTSFNHNEFWGWVRKNNKKYKIFISESIAPDDFKCIWEKKIGACLTLNSKNKKRMERLFIYNG